MIYIYNVFWYNMHIIFILKNFLFFKHFIKCILQNMFKIFFLKYILYTIYIIYRIYFVYIMFILHNMDFIYIVFIKYYFCYL